MKEIQYVGEHLLPGQLGNFFVILAFSAALLSSIAYLIGSFGEHTIKESWRKLGRYAFFIHAIAVIGIVATLFHIILNHYFEYQYAWQHSSKDLPVRYMFSCFWEGQEGSFLLWMLWHAVLGSVLIFTSRKWEPPVMSVFASVQIFLSSMLLGVYILDYKLGNNPFVLLREHPDFIDLPWTKVANYLKNLDGRGLNPLLRNYWMTIHPPTLFLGFAATLIPFAYAMAGLITGQLKEWTKPALPWTFFGVLVLGTGVLMGGAWAYESLSFGGFWAWDPVENSSLVPWIILVGAGHLMLIYKNRGQSLFTALAFTLLSFLLVLYSTFLTRSGILGKSSVHAFTDLGMSGQLLVYLLFYVVLSIFLLIKHRKKIAEGQTDDNATSREFWMFIGSLILLVSSFQIIFTTSIPVINKLFSLNLAPPTNPIEHYNSWQIPFSILILTGIAIAQFFKYKSTSMADFYSKIKRSLFIAVIISALSCWALEITNLFLIALLLASVFAFLSNLDYALITQKGKWSKAGPSLAHAGFALLMLGALISTGKSNVISQNTSGYDVSKLGKDFNNMEHIMLVKNDTVKMGNYFLTYKGKKVEGVNHYFNIDYFTRDEAGKFKHEFMLSPIVQTNPRMGNSAEPDTRHFLHKDVYTHIAYAELSTEDKHVDEGFPIKKDYTLQAGDTVFTSGAMLVLEGLIKEFDQSDLNLKPGDLAVAAKVKILTPNGKVDYAQPIFSIRENMIIPVDVINEEEGIKFSFTSIDPESGKINMLISEKDKKSKDFIILKAIIFPWINLLWLGCLLMVIGTAIAIVHRVKANNKQPA